MNSGAGCRLYMPGEALCGRVTHSGLFPESVHSLPTSESHMKRFRGQVSLEATRSIHLGGPSPAAAPQLTGPIKRARLKRTMQSPRPWRRNAVVGL